MGVHNIIENQGISLVVTGMTIVFFALVMVSILIALLPKVLAVLLPAESAAPPPSRSAPGNESSDEALVAAIGLALRQRCNRE